MIEITFRGTPHRVPARVGATLLDLAHEAGVPLRYACRLADCGTCVVEVEGEGLSTVSRAETACLRHVGAPPGSRLACQARVETADASLRVQVA